MSAFQHFSASAVTAYLLTLKVLPGNVHGMWQNMYLNDHRNVLKRDETYRNMNHVLILVGRQNVPKLLK